MGLKRKKKIPITTEEDDVQSESSSTPSIEERDADFSQLSGDEETGSLEGETEMPAGATEGDDQWEPVVRVEGDKLQAELKKTREDYLRALADLENFRKRTMRERSDLLKYQGERVFTDILPIVDNLELALNHVEGDADKFREGVQLILKMFQDVLTKWEVRPAPGIGTQFDPNKHAAISRVPTADETPGIILSELKKAYFYKDRLLREGEVVVAVEPVEEEVAASEGVDGESEEAPQEDSSPAPENDEGSDDEQVTQENG